MDNVRNNIHIYGITPENQLPDKTSGSAVQYSDIETIFIPEDKPPVKKILQTIIQVQITSSKVIKTPICRTMIIDGIKKFKIFYTDSTKPDNANFIALDIPYNTFIELPQGNIEVGRTDVFVLDAYFHVIDKRKIYSCILYLVNVNLSNGISKDGIRKEDESFTALKPNNTPLKTMGETPSPEEIDTLAQPKEITTPSADAKSTGDSLLDIDAEYL